MPPQITNIEQQLARDEGRSLKLYQDTKKLWTTGIGHNTGTQDYSKTPVWMRGGITDQQCDALFNADMHHVYALLDIYAPWWRGLPGGIDGTYAGVLLNMGFNMGVEKLGSFHTFLELMRKQAWEKAAADLATTDVFKELPVRYGRLRFQILKGAWQ